MRNRLLLYLVLLFIIIFFSTHILWSAYNPIINYDMGKVISYIDLYPGFFSYIEHLKFGQGIATQVYLLSQVTDVTPRLLKVISYIFFVLTFFLTLYQFRPDANYDQNPSILALVATAAATFIFFSSTVLTYLGSYGMLVYGQSFFFGALLLHFSRTYIWSEKILEPKVAAKWLLVFVLGTFIDIRLSFFLFMAFAIAVLPGIGNWKEVKKKTLLGGLLGVFLILPIGTQFYFLNDIVNFRPNHVLKLFYDGSFQFGEVADFLMRNLNLYLESLVGKKTTYQVAFLFFLVVGTTNELRFKAGRSIVVFSFLSLLILIVTALLDIYPFGSVRYTVTLFAFLLYLFLSGVYFIVLNIIRKTPKPVLRVAFVGVLTLFSGWLSLPEINKSIAVSKKISVRESLVIDNLQAIGESDNKVWCDLASEKIALGHRVECQLMATWNFQSGKKERVEFYAKLDKDLSKIEGKIAFFLYRPFSIPFFDPVREILDKYSIQVTNQFHGKTHIYILEKQPATASKKRRS